MESHTSANHPAPPKMQKINVHTFLTYMYLVIQPPERSSLGVPFLVKQKPSYQSSVYQLHVDWWWARCPGLVYSKSHCGFTMSTKWLTPDMNNIGLKPYRRKGMPIHYSCTSGGVFMQRDFIWTVTFQNPHSRFTFPYLELVLESGDSLCWYDLGQEVDFCSQSRCHNVRLSTRYKLIQGVVNKHILSLQCTNTMKECAHVQVATCTYAYI